jgi:hypothetical protein
LWSEVFPTLYTAAWNHIRSPKMIELTSFLTRSMNH